MKILFALLSVVLFSSTNSFAQSQSSTLAQIKETGKVRIGYRKSEPPMSFLNKEGKSIGYSIDICNRIVIDIKEALSNPDIKVEYVPVDAHDRFTALSDNKIDILCGSTTKTMSRSKLVDFTQLTFVTGASLMTLKGKEFKDFSELDDKKVGVVENTTTLNHLENLLKQSFSLANVQQYKSAEDAMNALRKGEIAAFSSDQVILIGLIITAEDKELYNISPNVFSYEPFALAVRQNDSEFMFLANNTISKLSRSRQILKLYNKWFGGFSDEIPPLIEALYKLNAIPK
jgi:glutamate/aspartate transport system substrate-binding protein